MQVDRIKDEANGHECLASIRGASLIEVRHEIISLCSISERQKRPVSTALRVREQPCASLLAILKELGILAGVRCDIL